MPQAPKFHPNERVDLADFELAAKDYTQDSVAALSSRTLFADKHRFISGFRIEVSDQTVSPGEFTVYNGFAFERGGLSLHNEDALNTARTATLVGASTVFYVEVEFVESDVETDSRAFWDPTVSNGGAPNPDGREFPIDVPTRIAPDWRIVTPISTTGFAVTSNPNSPRIPLARFTTDVANEIVATVNAAASVVTTTIAPAATSVQLLNTVIFPDSGSITLSSGTGSAETLAFSANDRANGILTLAAPTANTHTAGAVVVVVGGADFLAERLEAPVSGSSVDVRERLFQGSEQRGSVLQSSYRGAGLRDDLQLERLKDYVDFLAAQVRELKFGNPDPAVVSAAPPAAFSTTPRYYDRVGSVAGARGHTVSIGNGVTTFGDFNGTDETPFIAALAALPSAGGVIFIQPGTYTFANTVTVNKEVVFKGSGRDTTSIVSNVAGGSAFNISQVSSSDICELLHLSIDRGTGDINIITFSGTGGRLHLNDCFVLDTIQTPAGVTTSIVATNTSFASTVACFGLIAGTDVLQNARFTNCVLSAPFIILGGFSNVTISNSSITTAALLGSTANGSNALVNNCNIVLSGPALSVVATFTADNICFSNNTITGTGTASTVPFLSNAGEITNLVVADNVFNFTFSGTTSAAPGEVFAIGDAITGFTCTGNTFTTNAGSYVDVFRVADALENAVISSNKFEHFARLTYLPTGGVISNSTITKNVWVNVTATYGVDVFRFDTGSSFFRNIVANNLCVVTTTSTGVRGAYIDGGIVLIESVEFTDNDFVLNGTGYMHGVFGTADLPVESSININGNMFDLSGTLAVSCVTLLNNSDAGVHVVGNVATRLVTTGASDSVGVYVTGACTVANNRLSNIESNAGTAKGILCVRGLITNNQIIDVDSTSASLNTVGIQADSGCVVLGNYIDLTTATGQNVGVYHTGGGTLTIQSNRVLGGSATSYGVYVLPGVGPITSLSITDNFITGLSRAGVASGIEVLVLGVADENIHITGNTIIETVFGTTHRGIQLEATALVCPNVTVQGNTITGITPTVARNASSGCGIRLAGVQNFSISNNNVRWSGSNANGVNSVVVVNGTVGTITTNRITPNSSGAFDEILLTTTDNVLIHGNYIGDGSITGSINIGGAANVTNSDNKLL